MTNNDMKNNLLKIGGAVLANRPRTAVKLLREHVQSTIGFEQLSKETGFPLIKLKRIFAPNGEPRAREFFASLRALQQHAGITLRLTREV